MSTWLVTGSSRGIGLELCKVLLAKGHQVIGACRNPEGCRDHWELSSDFKSRFKSIKLDVLSDDDIQKLPEAIGDQPLDCLINNAGVFLGEKDRLVNLNYDELLKSFQVNTIAPMKITASLIPSLSKSKNPKVSHITSKMGSITDNTSGGYHAYRMSKAALNMFHKGFSKDFPMICSLVLHPGWVQTSMGGSSAPIAPIDSAEGLIDVIERATIRDSGSFFDFRGERIPW